MGADPVNCHGQKPFDRTMKTQLLQDFNESGSAPSGKQTDAAGQPQAPPADATAPSRPSHPAHPPHPSVWHRAPQEPVRTPTADAAPDPEPTPTPVSPPGESLAAQSAPATADPPTIKPAPAEPAPRAPRRVKAHGFAPQPAGFAGAVPPPVDTTLQWSPDTVGGVGDPDWLTERLARDAEINERSEWSGRWARHLATWGAAGVLLALLAGGGLWLYEQSQVEGALVVVANTNPAPAGAATRPRIGQGSPGLPVVAPVSTSAPAPAGAKAADDNSIDSSSSERIVKPVDLTQPDTAPPKRQRSHARKHPKADASAAASDSEPTARQRREETLMQCRAHGYGERQCVERGCEMTRYGFACKG
jgi:hypothetical protein